MGRVAPLVLLLLSSTTAEARIELGASVEAGVELDTNATRIQPLVISCTPGQQCECGAEQCTCVEYSGDPQNPTRTDTGDLCAPDEDPIQAGLMRLTASGRLTYRPTDNHTLSLGLSGGGKIFIGSDARSADELVQRLDVGWGMAIHRLGLLSLSGSYYDAFQRQSLRDFRTGSGLVGVAVGRPRTPLLIHLHLGYRGLEYKPFPEYDFHSLLGGVRAISHLTSGPADDEVDWTLTASYDVAHRLFSGNLRGPPRFSDNTWETPTLASGREDLNHMLRAEVGYLGNADAAIWYGLEINQSNSYGESYARHSVGIRFTTPLLWEIYMTVMGVLQFSSFQDPFFVSPLSTQQLSDQIGVDNENRSRLVIRLAREVVKRWSLTLRYSIYVNEAVSHEDLPQRGELRPFLRQTLFGGVRFEYGE